MEVISHESLGLLSDDEPATAAEWMPLYDQRPPGRRGRGHPGTQALSAAEEVSRHPSRRIAGPEPP